MSSLGAHAPPQTPQTPHRHSHHSAQSRHSRRPDNHRRKSAPAPHYGLSSSTATSPEVINSLVDSLSKLQPSPLHNPHLYGSLAPPEPEDTSSTHHGSSRDADYDGYLHPDDAALAPVVRTSKPPSGYSSHTKGEYQAHSRRSSYHSGISVGKGGVDIPSYVRNYMNRAAGPEGDRRSSRESSLSGSLSGRSDSRRDASGRLSYVSSHERIRLEKNRENLEKSERDRELRSSAAGILTATGGREIDKSIPQRSSSYGKSDAPNRNHHTYPASLMIGIPPPHRSPMGSPGLAPPGLAEEFDDDDQAAPPPELHRTRDRKRNSRSSFPKRSDSLPSAITKSRRISGEKITSPIKLDKTKRKSEPNDAKGGLFANQTSPARPSFQSTGESLLHDRPGSADSVDDAVDAYLCSPRLSQKIRMPNSGRIISFSEVGDPQGFAVFVCVGMGLTRYVTAFYDELALTLGLRLITPDRPGVGESEAISENERTVLNWPDDVLYICQSLKITKFSILAHSAGAIYALATALRMPGHIRGKIHLLAPWIPPSQMEAAVTKGEGKGEKVGSIPTSQRILRALPTPILKAANSSFMSATSSSLTTSLPRTGGSSRKTRKRNVPTPAPAKLDLSNQKGLDAGGPISPTTPGKENIDPRASAATSPNNREQSPQQIEDDLLAAAMQTAAEKERQMSYDERLTSAIWTLSTRNANPAVDLLVCLERNRPVGFRYVDITREVVIHHGARDTRVPVENVHWLGKTMRRCEVRILTTEGHGLMASAMVMGGVLDEIATEWRDWRKVVEGRAVEGGGRERKWAN
ncbi:Alpha/Beta hydrolase protein [Geopyxis carbonaria]|nr:Alpha/Beta hydrolase protein [Geopyxis carbonaria]